MVNYASIWHVPPTQSTMFCEKGLQLGSGGWNVAENHPLRVLSAESVGRPELAIRGVGSITVILKPGAVCP